MGKGFYRNLDSDLLLQVSLTEYELRLLTPILILDFKLRFITPT